MHKAEPYATGALLARRGPRSGAISKRSAKTYPATDMIGTVAIFNIRGNRYRLIVRSVFPYRRVYAKEFLTHAEYTKGAWKKWLR